MSEREVSAVAEAVGLTTDTIQAIDCIQKFCASQSIGCASCPLFAGMPGEDSGCIYQNFTPSEVSIQRIVDMNSFNIASSKDESNLPAQGSIVRIAGRDAIVLDYQGNHAIVLFKNCVTYMRYGNSGDYLTSEIREYLNTDFYEELANAIGAENIIKHRVDLTADDGSGADISCEDFISAITTDNQRKYNKFIPDIDDWSWTATRKSEYRSGWTRSVCYVDSSGVLDWGGCDCDGGGVRPFCVLNSSILVTQN